MSRVNRGEVSKTKRRKRKKAHGSSRVRELGFGFAFSGSQLRCCDRTVQRWQSAAGDRAELDLGSCSQYRQTAHRIELLGMLVSPLISSPTVRAAYMGLAHALAGGRNPLAVKSSAS